MIAMKYKDFKFDMSIGRPKLTTKTNFRRYSFKCNTTITRMIKILPIQLFLTLLFFTISCSDDAEEVINLPFEGTEWLKTELRSLDCGSTLGTSTGFSCTQSNCSSIFFFDSESFEIELIDNVRSFNRAQYDVAPTSLRTDVFGAEEVFEYTISGNILQLKQRDDSSGCEFITEYRGRTVSDPQEFIQDLLTINQPLEGTVWIEGTIITTECDNPLESGSNSCDSGDCEQLIMNDGTVIINVFENDQQLNNIIGTYTVSGGRINFDFDENSVRQSFSANFQIESSQLVLTYADEESGCDTVKIYTSLG